MALLWCTHRRTSAILRRIRIPKKCRHLHRKDFHPKPQKSVIGTDLPADSDVWMAVEHIKAAVEVRPGSWSERVGTTYTQVAASGRRNFTDRFPAMRLKGGLTQPDRI